MQQQEKHILHQNKLALDQLKLANYNESLALLKSAERELKTSRSKNVRLKTIIFNNIGNVYKNSLNFIPALKYLQRAAKIQSRSGQMKVDKAGTNLDICNILSKLGKHQSGLQYAQRAIHLLSDVRQAKNQDQNAQKSLLLAYMNAGREAELGGDFPTANQHYSNGEKFAKQYFPNHNLVEQLAVGARRTLPIQPPRKRNTSKNLRLHMSMRIESPVFTLKTSRSRSPKSRSISVRGTLKQPLSYLSPKSRDISPQNRVKIPPKDITVQ